MDENRIATLLELIAEAVHEDGPWREKAKKIIREATERDKDNLREFAGWFNEDQGE